MVIRDLTLRSAASFGSFHLIRLLYDEYMFYLIEHKVAQVSGRTPIAIMTEVSSSVHAIHCIVCALSFLLLPKLGSTELFPNQPVAFQL